MKGARRSLWRSGAWSLPALLLFQPPARGQQVNPAIDRREPAGARPYEMVWAHRVEPAAPTVRFDDLRGWRLRVEGGAEAILECSRAQNVWNRPVGKLRYRGAGQARSTPRIFLIPPQPVPLNAGDDSVDLWVYGNRWSWVNPPDTPPVRIRLRFRGSAASDGTAADGGPSNGKPFFLPVDLVRWQEWWLLHKRLPAALARPCQLESIEVSGGWQKDWREIYFDSIRFYREPLGPLKFAARPKRPLALFAGQCPGANTGPGTLAFPTREQTILPAQFEKKFRTALAANRANGGEFVFSYRGADGDLNYHFRPAQGLPSLHAEWNGQPAGDLMADAGMRWANAPTAPPRLSDATQSGRDEVTADYSDGSRIRLRLWQKSLVIDCINPSRRAVELNLGRLTRLRRPRLIFTPYLNFGGGAHPSVLLSYAGERPVFTSLWLDWYRSNGSELFAAEQCSGDGARINGGVRYLPRTDGQRNPMFERIFLTVSPRFEETLPTVANPAGQQARQACDRLWQESWGPDNYQEQMQRSERLRAYGIENLIQCNHEIAWRDGGESFTLRLRAAPKKGGDAALKNYVAHQRKLGWLEGLYSNYTDFAPVNQFWNPDWVQRQPDGNWRSAWPRCWALKPLAAVQLDARLAPQLKKKYRPTSAYTDVHTAVAPWGYNDCDARVPGAGTFAQTFYSYGELLRNDSRAYGGPIFSEGTYQWLYAGLADGNYGLAYDGRPLAKEPLLPVFDLREIHPKECDIGMGWTAFFCDAIPDWRAPKNLDRAIDRFLLHTLAYGHIGWLVEEEHGLERTCRSYYMLQQVQARYGLLAPSKILYWDGRGFCAVSEAIVRQLPAQRRQLFIEYPNGLRLWLNDHPRENWSVEVPTGESSPATQPGRRGANGRRILDLPPAGWAAFQPGELFTFSALNGHSKADYLRSAAYVYLDGRGQWFSTPEAAANGALAIRSPRRNQLDVIRISGQGGFVIRRPFGVARFLKECAACDVEGKRLSAPACQDLDGETRVAPVDGAVAYRLIFHRSK